MQIGKNVLNMQSRDWSKVVYFQISLSFQGKVTGLMSVFRGSTTNCRMAQEHLHVRRQVTQGQFWPQRDKQRWMQAEAQLENSENTESDQAQVIPYSA